MLYMVVVALGFAAVENMLYLFSSVYNLPSFDSMISAAIAVLIVRFIGATFLHTLCSALVGYFSAMASLYSKKKVLLVATGLLLAIILHGLYDFSIITLPYPFNAIIPGIVILTLALFMLYDFNEIKKVKSICKL
jgi:RsiW-degrading membrane proteinase PrsW (M82 family)